ncbi:hemolysin family protein [Maridesulfovibrio hydrothermalis]|uniref:CBS domain containing protein n=1 Tax=Maridesulfovibrio hydrothermalis AM13 = DSM 14728 TaxID=1121451 RepID=L0RBZ4_9BACT|nr:hemolysin family protein [Maridesulfovibrio hydrothermalis]CCO24274.1 CBS domain containing protein [Maridesulfovibrio hydrothermalis AM13 = DSM 14728]
MDDGSEGRLWAKMVNIFKKADSPLEEHILEAREDGEIKGEVVSMLLNVLELKDTAASEIMIPRTDMIGVELEAGLAEVAKLIIEYGHSRIPVYQNTKDKIIGIIHAKDVIAPLLNGDIDISLEKIMRAPFFASEHVIVKTLLKEFQSGRIHMAILQDEYGGTSGLITMEDVLEEIVGEISDEHDVDRPSDFNELESGKYLVSGRVPLTEVSEKLGLKLDSEHVDSIGGYLSELTGRIPHVGEFINISGYKFTVHEGDAKQIITILIDPPAGK